MSLALIPQRTWNHKSKANIDYNAMTLDHFGVFARIRFPHDLPIYSTSSDHLLFSRLLHLSESFYIILMGFAKLAMHGFKLAVG